MYTKTLLATAALMATTAIAGNPGSAVIINACTYPVYFSAVPAAYGGHEETSKTLQPKETWTTPWTELTNGAGWSLKLSKTPALTNILQYEYTFHNDGIIWYDLSCVDGNPWNGNWEISAAGAGCAPRQAYYRYDTDDAFGMQSCHSDATITVTLCSGEKQADNIVDSVVAAVTKAIEPVVAAATTQAAAATEPAYVAPTPSPAAPAVEPAYTAPAAAPVAPVVAPAYVAPAAAATPLVAGHALAYGDQHFYDAAAVVAPVPTTLATIATAAGDIDYVTEIVTVVHTAYAYETYVPSKRHVHHPNHPQFAS